ncbi:hypothetical protein [Actinomadura sp. WMMB 499]|uniref:hypothetical protein n=1 Tax=Actinomadura sp. WMMB 499 TaxID=1219491 RepID=UPI0020C7B451|nr:hypothetical protein [Actinomadura sp. WMMB 499]
MVFGEVAGEECADGSGAAGDEDGAVGVEGLRSAVPVVGRVRRGMRVWPLRRAVWGSVVVAVGVVVSVSMRVMRSGCSFWALRMRPQMAACPRSVTGSSGPVETAPRVTTVR